MGKLREEKRMLEHRPHKADLIVSDDDNACGNQRIGKLASDVAQSELPQAEQMGGPVNCTNSELSIYLQALAEGYLVTSCLDTIRFVQSKSTPIASKSYRLGKKTVAFPGFPSLQMSHNLTGDRGKEKCVLSRVGFRART